MKHLQTSAMPRMQALSSNQTLTQQDGISSKERLPSSKLVTGRNNQKYDQGSPKAMNADLTMVDNEKTQAYFNFSTTAGLVDKNV